MSEWNDRDPIVIEPIEVGGGGNDWDEEQERIDNEDSDRDSGGNHSSWSDIDLKETPEAMAVMSYAAIPMTAYPINGVLGFTINWGAIDAALVQGINVLSKALPYAGGLTAGVLVGALYPSQTIMSEAREQALLDQYRSANFLDKTKPYKIVSLPSSAVTTLPTNQISKSKVVPVSALAEPVVNLDTKKREVAITQQTISTMVSVVQAQKTKQRDVYTAQIIPGMKPVQIQVNQTKSDNTKNTKANTKPKVDYVLPIASAIKGVETHHAVVYFDDSHDPVYVSISQNPKENKNVIETTLAEWSSLYPLEFAKYELEQANNQLEKEKQLVEKYQKIIYSAKQTKEYQTLLDPVKSSYYYQKAYIETPDELTMILSEQGVEALSAYIMVVNNWFGVITDTGQANQFNQRVSALHSDVEFVRNKLINIQGQVAEAEKLLLIAVENRKKAEEKKKVAEDKVEDIEKKLGAYGEVNAKGKSSGREFNKDKAGGPIKDLDWKDVKIDRDGVDKVKLHTGRFGESADNKEMIDRLEKILRGEIKATDIDKRFYTHEIRELERYRNLGIKDGEVPNNIDEVWNNTHTATLEDYNINERTQPLYTPEAIEAYDKSQEIR